MIVEDAFQVNSDCRQLAEFRIRPVRPSDQREWLSMWQAYCHHFNSPDTSRSVLLRSWRRVLSRNGKIRSYVAESDRSAGELIGFANLLQHEYLFSDRPVCCLCDLWIVPALRGAGVGTQMLNYIVELCRVQALDHIYWFSDRENLPAQNLYNKFSKRKHLVRYSISV